MCACVRACALFNTGRRPSSINHSFAPSPPHPSPSVSLVFLGFFFWFVFAFSNSDLIVAYVFVLNSFFSRCFLFLEPFLLLTYLIPSSSQLLFFFFSYFPSSSQLLSFFFSVTSLLLLSYFPSSSQLLPFFFSVTSLLSSPCYSRPSAPYVRRNNHCLPVYTRF